MHSLVVAIPVHDHEVHVRASPQRKLEALLQEKRLQRLALLSGRDDDAELPVVELEIPSVTWQGK